MSHKRPPNSFLLAAWTLCLCLPAAGCKETTISGEASASSPIVVTSSCPTVTPASGPAASWASTVEDGGAAGTSTWASFVAVDLAANVYIVGSSGNTLTELNHYFLTKFNPSGTKEWTVEDGTSSPEGSNQEVNGTQASGLATDAEGNIYVIGTTTGGLDGQPLVGLSDFFLTKYDPCGTRQWTVEDGTSGVEANGAGVAVSASGNIFVTGSTDGSLDGQVLLGGGDYFLSRYNSSGVRQWTVLDGASTQNYAGTPVTWGSGIAVDTDENVYVTGATTGPLDGQSAVGGDDIFVSRYDSSGVRQWTAEDGALGETYGNAVAVDASENVYVTGITDAGLDGEPPPPSASPSTLFLIKYNPSGARQWTVEGLAWVPGLAPSPGEDPKGIALDAAGNVYVTGSAPDSSYFLTQINPDGVLQWAAFDTPSGMFHPASAYGLALDALGNIYVTGTAAGSLDGQTLHSDQDFFVTQYTPAGAIE